jgi:hypothetical protein
VSSVQGWKEKGQGWKEKGREDGYEVVASSGDHFRAGTLVTLPLRKHRVHTRIRRTEPSITARTLWRLGWNVRFVTLCAWLMLEPETVLFPQ